MKKILLSFLVLLFISSCAGDVQNEEMSSGVQKTKSQSKSITSKTAVENYDFILSDRSDAVPNSTPTNYVSGYIQIYSPQLYNEGYTFELEYFIGNNQVFGIVPTIYLPANTHYAEINPYDMIQLYGCGGKTVSVKVKTIRKGRFQIVNDKTVLSACNISLYLANCNINLPDTKPSDTIGGGPKGL
ncbi:hypothetical protein [Chryseobacterium paridis]|uniref:Lipoprotein n=1 Tax=Chryseobacterium paridis TaxID=2800328 RepID=A0ABS1FRS6_9FLAO|nr:hypothetical protein [Chryseobacterium paridis]MBK1894964.1 hypothetical protein [Chryseobacterium paridis]